MRATTTNLESPREPRCHHAGGPEPPTHVRPVLQEDLDRQVRDVAAEFKAFIDAHPDEQAWLTEWDGADLAAAPGRGAEA